MERAWMNGLGYALIAASLWGIAAIFDKCGLHGVPRSLWISLAVRTVPFATILLILVCATGQIRELTNFRLSSIICLASSGILATLIGQFFYYKALKPGEASIVVPIVGAYPLVTAVLAVIILREKVTWFKAAGALLVVAGVFLLRMKS